MPLIMRNADQGWWLSEPTMADKCLLNERVNGRLLEFVMQNSQVINKNTMKTQSDIKTEALATQV